MSQYRVIQEVVGESIGVVPSWMIQNTTEEVMEREHLLLKNNAHMGVSLGLNASIDCANGTDFFSFLSAPMMQQGGCELYPGRMRIL